ncbi:META domain-containing protein [Suttonella ornithocola]|uniref:META domain n=1 Tax=Suttonella ornithocola TaxID=279832 RepID=A0A380MPT4_9GAMM|nr:META domain-containing protein [Suttonella ornithocola]SUO94332.1 META domain [Suttonella ornithocola]
MNIKAVFLSIFGMAVLSLTGCQSSNLSALSLVPNDSQTVSDAMNNGYWQLTQAEIDGKTLIISAPITLSVHNGEFSGQSGINRYRTEAKLQNGSLEVDNNIQTTRMAGPVNEMRLESDYLSALRRVNHYQRNGETLSLSGDGVSLQYRATQP